MVASTRRLLAVCAFIAFALALVFHNAEVAPSHRTDSGGNRSVVSRAADFDQPVLGPLEAIDDRPRNAAGSAASLFDENGIRRKSVQKSSRGRGHHDSPSAALLDAGAAITEPSALEGVNLIGHRVHGTDHGNVSCASLIDAYNMLSSPLVVRPSGCWRFSRSEPGGSPKLDFSDDDDRCFKRLPLTAAAAREIGERLKRLLSFDPQTVLNRRCSDDPRVRIAPDTLVSCRGRSRIFGVLVVPSEEAKRGSQGVIDGAQSLSGLVRTLSSFPMPQCDTWNLLRCQASRNPDVAIRRAVVDVSTSSDAARAAPLWSLLWPTFGPASDAYFCGKTGAPARPFMLGDKPYFTLVKGRRPWHYMPLNGSRFYRFRDVTHFQGVYFHSDRELTGGSTDAAAKVAAGAAPSEFGVDFDFAGYFHIIDGQWPREVVSSLRLYPLSLLPAYQQQGAIAASGPLVRTVDLEVAYHAPAMDFKFSYHVLGDGLFPMIHALRHRLAENLTTPLILYRPLSTRFGFGPSSCFYGVDICVLYNPVDGGFGELVEFLAGGAENIHFVDVPIDGRFPPAKDAIAEYEALRVERARNYSTSVFKIGELYAGNPSHCSLSTTTEMPLIENSDAVRLGRGHLDCVVTMMVFRDVVARMCAEPPRVRTPPAFVPRGDGAGPPPSSRQKVANKRVAAAARAADRAASIGKREPLECTLHDTIDTSQRRFVSYMIGPQCWRDESKAFIPPVTSDPPYSGADGAIHLVFVVRHRAKGRVILEESELMAAIRKHLTVVSDHTRHRRAQNVRFTVTEISSLRDAMRIISSATLLILTHGAAMMYLPFLRPNAAVITIDLVRPTVVPLMPTWVHWGEIRPSCDGKPSVCNSVTYELVKGNIRFDEQQTKELLRMIDALLELQKIATIFTFD